MHLDSVQNVNDGQVERLEGALSILNNYLGQLRERALEVIELLYKPFLDKILMIGIPQSNIAEIEKIQIKVIVEFLKMIQKVFLDYTASVFLTPRNHGYLKSLIDYCLNLIRANLDDQFCNKFLLNILQCL